MEQLLLQMLTDFWLAVGHRGCRDAPVHVSLMEFFEIDLV
jgi:hypothetical protein